VIVTVIGDSLAHVSARLTVVGSINLDLVAKADRLPRVGETVSGAAFSEVPGGKGANQAVAAARLGAEVTLVACVGDDEFAELALRDLRGAGVTLELVTRGATGVALIVVDAAGENTIVVAPGSNAALVPGDLPEIDESSAVLCQLEIPLQTVEQAALAAPAEFFLNAAPAPTEPLPSADVTIVNRYELEALSHREGVIAVTLGAEGAILMEDGEEVARAAPPPVQAVDGTAAGDAFTACLVVSLLESRMREEALRRACIAGALAASRFGAQTSLPTAAEVDALL
jgi:ribokinase